MTNILILDTYSLFILLAIGLHAMRQMEKTSLQNRLFSGMLQLAMLTLVFDFFSRFDGNPGSFYPVMNSVGNFVIFALSPVLPSIWLIYIHYQVFHDEARTKKLYIPMAVINAINFVLVLLSGTFKWLYYIDENNIYHRGSYYLFGPVLVTVLILAAFFILFSNRKDIEKKHYMSLAFFPIPPFICIFLQSVFYGTSLIMHGIVLSLLIVYLNIQTRNMYTDYLTGISNRKKLETYLREKIRLSAGKKPFSMIIFDFSNYEAIKGAYGQSVSDGALRTAADLIKNCIRANDLLARFSGGEFCAILDISNKSDLQMIIGRIDYYINAFNETSSKPYRFSLNMGYDIYDPFAGMKAEEFLTHVDDLMRGDQRKNA